MPQAAAVYPLLGVAAPWVALRPQALILEPRQAERLEEAGLRLSDLLAGRKDLDRTLARQAGEDFVAPARRRVEEALAGVREPALALDPNLERPWEKTREQILRALDLFAEKATGAAARRNEVQVRRVEALRESCLPLGKLQERVICAAHFQGRYGPRFTASFVEQMELDPRVLQVVLP
jgi:uncharacterized protein YllA (UPF0747 family)